MWAKFLAACFFFSFGKAQLSATCSPTLTPKYPLPSVAPGYVVRLVAKGLTTPRSIKLDSAGHLLVIESGVGVSALTFDYGKGGCIRAKSKATVVSMPSLNHGLELSADGNTLYASDVDKAYSWTYSASSQSVSNGHTVVVEGMNGTDHVTRTLLLSQNAPGTMLVSRGSDEDIDYSADQVPSGISQIRAFNINNTSNFPYYFNTSGTVMGYGLRNDVGMAEEPATGGLYSVENGVNVPLRNGVAIPAGNPAEKMNFLGYVDGTPATPNMGADFGYPECFAVWNTSIPNFKGKSGTVIGMSSSNDTLCQHNRQGPALVWAAHSAPIDILFNNKGTMAWITNRGTDNYPPKVGYGLATTPFSDGSPTSSTHSKTALTYIAQSYNYQTCNKQSCWAPVGLAWDSQGRLFMSTDNTGEIYVILRSDGSGPNS